MLAAGGCQLSEEQLWCCICLDIFSSPVTLPCGHNFCRSCIQEHLTSDPQRRCPLCQERVDKKHKLGVNTFISELAVQYRQRAGRKSGSSSEPRKAPCGAPVRPKPLTSRSWLLLAVSLLALLLLLTANLHLHQSLSGGETPPPEAETFCSEHQEPLELFCKNDQVSICRRCGATAHRFHQLVPLSDEFQEKKAELSKTEARIQQVLYSFYL